MELYLPDLKIISGRLLKLLNNLPINNTSDIRRFVRKSFAPELVSEDFIQFDERPSDYGTFGYTISYIRPKTGIPLELKFNPSLNRNIIILKAQDFVPEYIPFEQDTFRNIMQSRTINPCSVPLVKEELRRLDSL